LKVLEGNLVVDEDESSEDPYFRLYMRDLSMTGRIDW